MQSFPDPKTWKFAVTPEELKRLYERAHREFTEADLLKLFTNEEGIPFDELLAELEAMPPQEEKRG